MNIYEFIGTRIKQEREGRQLSQETLAKRLGIAANTLSRWETAVYKPRVDELDRVARELGISILDLLPPDEQRPDFRMQSLLRAAKDLSADDIETLRRFAEIRVAQSRVKSRSGRSRKRQEA